jgi:TolB-like protein/Tfp pilus assembly protein PilF
VVIDDTRRSDSTIPDRFRDLQWTHLPAGEATPAFADRVARLLAPELSRSALANHPTAAAPPTGTASALRDPLHARWRSKAVLLGILSIVVAGFGYFATERWLRSKQPAEARPPTSVPAAQAAATGTSSFNPPSHSIAVLPFVNMSGDSSQDYFADGLTEELLNSLTEVHELQVAARTSAFSFKGKDADIGTIARKLNVGAVLEGSVRRSGRTVRITAQLINSVSGFHLWSHEYDYDLGDVLKLQASIADAVASALKVTMLSDTTTKIELGGTHNPAALDAYLRAGKEGHKDPKAAIASYAEATRLDPNYAVAFAARSLALSNYANGPSEHVRESFDEAQRDALKAIALAPDLAVGHAALAVYLESGALDFARANGEYERALTLAPGNVLVLIRYSNFAASMGRFEKGILAARRAVVLDPLNPGAHALLGSALGAARQYDEAIAVYQESLALEPDDPETTTGLAFAYYALGNLQRARELCESTQSSSYGQVFLTVIYQKLGRPADAQAMLAKVRASGGDSFAFQYADIYAQWGNNSKALDWLETALRLRDPGLEYLKTDMLLDPLRNEPRFQAIERELKFTN